MHIKSNSKVPNDLWWGGSKVQVESEVQLEQVSARCEQPDNKNTRISTLYVAGNRVVALFTGGRSSAPMYKTKADNIPGSWVPD